MIIETDAPQQTVTVPIYVLYLIVTTDCMLDCDYCFVNKSKRYMDQSTAEKGIDFFLRTPGLNKLLKIYGGEPLLNFRLISKIVPFARKLASELKKELTITICTNMILVNEEIIDFFQRHKIDLALSSDGASEQQSRHRRFKGGRPSADIIEARLSVLNSKISEEKIAVNLTVPRECAKDLFDNFLYFNRRGIKTLNIEPVMSGDWSSEQRRIFCEQYKRVLDEILVGISQNRFFFITQLNREFKYGEVSEISRGGCLLKRGLQLSPEGEFFIGPWTAYLNNPDKVIGNLWREAYSPHFFCNQSGPEACANCRERYQKGLPPNNNPGVLRDRITILYADRIAKKASEHERCLYEQYLQSAVKHICF